MRRTSADSNGNPKSRSTAAGRVPVTIMVFKPLDRKVERVAAKQGVSKSAVYERSVEKALEGVRV